MISPTTDTLMSEVIWFKKDFVKMCASFVNIVPM